MNPHRRVSILGFLLLATALECLGQMNPKNSDVPERGPQPGEPSSPLYAALPGRVGPVHPAVAQLWKSLEGRYEGSEAGQSVSLTLRRISPYVLFAETRTEGHGAPEVTRGYVELGDASPSYNSRKLRYALAYRPDSIRNDWSCYFRGYPSAEHGDGVSFQSESSDCSFVVARTVAKLRLDVSADAIGISGEQDRETLVLRRVPAK